MQGLDMDIQNVAGRFDLLEFSELCANSALLSLGNESGPLHIAATHDIPIIRTFWVQEFIKCFIPQIKAAAYIHHYFLEKGHKNQTVNNSTIFKITVEEVIKSINELLAIKDEKVA